MPIKVDTNSKDFIKMSGDVLYSLELLLNIRLLLMALLGQNDGKKNSRRAAASIQPYRGDFQKMQAYSKHFPGSAGGGDKPPGECSYKSTLYGIQSSLCVCST